MKFSGSLLFCPTFRYSETLSTVFRGDWSQLERLLLYRVSSPRYALSVNAGLVPRYHHFLLQGLLYCSNLYIKFLDQIEDQRSVEALQML